MCFAAYLNFRTGYQYITSLSGNPSSSENRAIAELTARYPLPASFVILSRHRGDFRWVRGQKFSTRYRHRLWIERDMKVGRVGLSPYVYDEVYYDTRYDAWTTNRVALGIQFPAGPHLVLEPYVQRQENSRSTPRYTNSVGFKFNLFF
jgi:hypothetical protein